LIASNLSRLNLMFIEKSAESVLEWVVDRRWALAGMTSSPSFRRKPESRPTITFAERTSNWIPRSSRGMTVLGDGLTVELVGGMKVALGGRMTAFGGGMTARRAGIGGVKTKVAGGIR
jgi:hypothetical protein